MSELRRTNGCDRHECCKRRQSGMSARKKRKQRLSNTCETCRFYGIHEGVSTCYYDFQDEATTSTHSWCANYLPRGTSKMSHLIDAPNGRCCSACGYTPIKQDGNTCPLCLRTWGVGADNT